MLQGLPKSVDVAVIGAGMVGAATAFELQKRGKTVIVIDPNNAWGRASYGNSGSLPALSCCRCPARRFGAIWQPTPLIAPMDYVSVIRMPPAGEVPFQRSITNVSMGYGFGPEPGGARLVTGIELCQPEAAPNYLQIRRAVADFKQVMGKQADSFQLMENERQVWHGARPMTSDGLPVMGRAPQHHRIFFAFGHSHLGLASGPITGELIAQQINQEPTAISLAPFSIGRFQ